MFLVARCPKRHPSTLFGAGNKTNFLQKASKSKPSKSCWVNPVDVHVFWRLREIKNIRGLFRNEFYFKFSDLVHFGDYSWGIFARYIRQIFGRIFGGIFGRIFGGIFGRIFGGIFAPNNGVGAPVEICSVWRTSTGSSS